MGVDVDSKQIYIWDASMGVDVDNKQIYIWDASMGVDVDSKQIYIWDKCLCMRVVSRVGIDDHHCSNAAVLLRSIWTIQYKIKKPAQYQSF